MKSLEVLFFVKKGKNRIKVVKALDKPMMPSELTQKIFGSSSNTSFNLVSRALSELKEKGIVEILNPEEKTGRIYQLTKIGKEILINIKEEK